MIFNKEIDLKHEEILKYAINKFGTYQKFMNNIINEWTYSELMYDNINNNDKNYIEMKELLLQELKSIVKDPYSYKLNKKTLFGLNNKFFSKEIRTTKIIHRAFLHDISLAKNIDSELDDLFDNFPQELSIDNYFILIYKLYKIYPFWNSLSLRVFTNIYLLQNEYLPFFPSLDIKSEYFDTFKYDFFRFKKQFSKLFLANGEYFLR